MFLRWKNRILICLMSLVLIGMFLFCLLHKPQAFSDSERRPLKTLPQADVSSILSSDTTFMQDFETYTEDQFPMRDWYLKWNAIIRHHLFFEKVINGIYTYNGYAVKQEASLDWDALDWSLDRFHLIHEKYLNNQKTYLCIIPDKQFFTAADAGISALSYDDLYDYFSSSCSDIATTIDIRKQLALSNYYRTDLHWKQETLPDTAEYILTSMDAWNENTQASFSTLTCNTIDVDFYGVYKNQSHLPLKADRLSYLTSDYMQDLLVTDYDTGLPVSMPVYDLNKAYGRDSYEIFLGGAKSILTIKNQSCSNGKRLVVFRDSFGSSLAPLLAAGYEELTLIDIRYISPAMLDRFVDFSDTDVLFLYSTSVLNSKSFLN